MKQQQAQRVFQGMLQSLIWRFNPDQDTITYEEYLNIINSIEPSNYEIAYNLGSVNYIEKGTIEDAGKRLNSLIKERTWCWNGIQAFEIIVTTIPKLILIPGTKQEEPKTITTTFWVDKSGQVVAYRQIYNNQLLEDRNYLIEEEK